MTDKAPAVTSTQAETKPSFTVSLNGDRSGLLQRKCDCGNSAGLAGQCSQCQEKKLLQRRRTDPNEVSEVPPIVHEVLRSPGQPLKRDTRQFMESRFKQDFSQVRVHTDGRAAQSAQAVNALAYTVGQNVVFGSGQYQPHTIAGKKVLAHELTHVLQQNAMSHPPIATIKIDSSNDFYEREADTQAEKVVFSNEAIAMPTQRSDLAMQRLGDLTKVPAGLSCPLPTATRPPETDYLLFPDRGVALSPLQKAKIENFVMNWRAAGASAPVRVDGFASQVDTDELNWRLSCDRVRAVVAELTSPSSGTVSGIPASFISFFAQGETAEFVGGNSENRRVTLSMPAPPTRTAHRFRAAAVSFLGCAECNPFTDDGALALTPPAAEPAMSGTGYRQIHLIEAELATTDGQHIAPGSARLVTSGRDVGISHFCGSGTRAHVVSSAVPGSPALVTSTTGIEGIQFESELHSRVGSTVPPTLIGSPCDYLGTSPLIPIIGNTFRMRLFADGTKESEFTGATLYPSHYLYEDRTLKMFGGSPVHPRQDFYAWATSTGAPLAVSIIGFKALRFACCHPILSRIACETVCIGGFSAPLNPMTSPGKNAAHAAYLAARPCPSPCAPAGAGCAGGPIVRPSNP